MLSRAKLLLDPVSVLLSIFKAMARLRGAITHSWVRESTDVRVALEAKRTVPRDESGHRLLSRRSSRLLPLNPPASTPWFSKPCIPELPRRQE